MLIGKADTLIIQRISMVVGEVSVPVLRFMGAPANAISDFIKNIEELASIRIQNSQLKSENTLLLEWMAVANRLEDENRQLRDLLGLVSEPQTFEISARIVADTGGAFAQSVIITAGSVDGVQKGHAVVTGSGLVGRVSQSGTRSSRVLLINDINSKIPVRVGKAGHRAILAGNNTSRPSIIYLGLKSPVALGDRVVTSGDAGAFPPGLPIGTIVLADEKNVFVEPFASQDRLQYVKVLDFKILNNITDINSED